MQTIYGLFGIVNAEIGELKKRYGIPLWNELDLSDLLFAEFLAHKVKPLQLSNYSKLDKFKLVIHALLKRRTIRNVTIKDNYDILIFINSISQYNNLLPIVLEFSKSNISFAILTTKYDILTLLNERKLDAVFLYGFNFGKSKDYLSDDYSKLIAHFLPKLGYLYYSFSRVLKLSNPKYILVGNDNTFEGRLLVMMAMKYLIKTGCVQHGSISRVNPIHSRTLVDQIFVYGSKAKEELEFLGVNSQRVIISGWPQHGQVKALLVNSNWKGFGKPTVLLALSGPGHSVDVKTHCQIIDILKSIQERAGINICVKLHPKDSRSYYSSLDSNLTTVLDNEDLKYQGISYYELLSSAILVLTVASHAALESLLIGTPVITLDLNNSFGDVDFIKDGLTHHVHNYDELKNSILTLTSRDKIKMTDDIKAKIEQYYFNFFIEGYNPSLHIANIIQEICVE